MVNSQLEAWLLGLIITSAGVKHTGWPERTCRDALCTECEDIGWLTHDWINAVRPLGWRWNEEIK